MMKRLPISDTANINPRMPRKLSNEPARLVSFVPMASVSEQGGIVEEEERQLSDVSKGLTYFERGDVLVAKITPCLQNGKAAYVDNIRHDVGFGSTEFHVLRPFENTDGRYLFHMVWNPYFRTFAEHSFTGTAGQQRAPVNVFDRFKIPIPYADDVERSLTEQRRIAEILDKADSIRKKRSESLRLANEFLKSTFLDMFGDWLSQSVKTMHRLGDSEIAEVVSGVTKGRRFGNRKTVIVSYIRVANVQDGYLDLEEIKSIEALPSDIETLTLQQGDVLMTEGGDFDKLGRGAMWDVKISNCIHQNHVFRIRCNRDNLIPEFFAGYIQTALAKAYFLRCAKKTSNLASINMTQLRATPVPMPPIDLQNRFAEIVNEQRAMVAQAQQSSTQADSLFNSLVQRAFKGELR